MESYIGKVCPFCRTAFEKEDDVVVCSACEMPHHKDCWIENQGCTTFGCMGTIKGLELDLSQFTTGNNGFDINPLPVNVGSPRPIREQTFCIPEGQHAEGSPVLIERGVLQKVHTSNSAFAKVTIRNLSSKVIDSADVQVTMYDAKWQKTDMPVITTMDGFHASHNENFGETFSIDLPIYDVRAISCCVTKVHFEDGDQWVSSNDLYWKPLHFSQPSVADVITDNVLAEQYIKDIEKKNCFGKLYPSRYEGLWYCSCGAQNTSFDKACCNCGISEDELFDATTISVLEEHRDQAIKEREERRERNKRRMLIGTGIAAGIAALTAASIFFFIPLVKYCIADTKVIKEDYSAAIAYYEDLEGFLKSEEHLLYANALKTIDDGNIEKGIKELLAENIPVDIAYSLDGGEFVKAGAKETVSLVQSSDFKSLETAKKAYYDFEGWKANSIAFNPRKADLAQLNLIVHFTPTEYKITYESEGSINANNPASYNYESEAITLKTPVRKGYTFTGWSDSEGNDVTKKIAIPAKSHGEVTFVASWTPNTYKVTINPSGEKSANGGDFTTTVFEFTYDSDYSLPKAAKAGYTFLGWKDSSGTYLSGTWTVDKDVTLSPSFEIVTYKISYDLQGGNAASNKTSYTVQSGDIKISNPSCFGYTFVGWTWEGNANPTTNAVLKSGNVGDKHFVAHWKGNPHTVYLNANGGTVSTPNYGVTYGSTYSLPTPYRRGYTFLGWYNGNTSYSSGTWLQDSDLNVTAKWEKARYTITFSDPLGKYYGSTTKTVYYGDYVYLGSLYATGYTFDGWYCGSDYLGTSSFTFTYEQNVVITATWTPDKKTITLDANGGTGISSTYTFTYGSSYLLPTPEREGYTFSGWYTSRSSYGTRVSSSGTYDGSYYWGSTLYAHWTAN